MMLLSENLLLLASLLVFVAILVSKVGSKLVLLPCWFSCY